MKRYNRTSIKKEKRIAFNRIPSVYTHTPKMFAVITSKCWIVNDVHLFLLTFMPL